MSSLASAYGLEKGGGAGECVRCINEGIKRLQLK